MFNKKKTLKRKLRINTNKNLFIPILIVAGILLLVGIYYFSPWHERLDWQVTSWRSDILYFIKPPAKASFNPSQQEMMESVLASTLTVTLPTPTFTTTQAPTKTISPIPTQTPLPTLTPTPIPSSVQLKGIVHEFQKGNNCGPTNLAMALSYWGWEGNQYTTAAVLKPKQEDRNVMPYEMVEYVQEHTGFGVVQRYGGDVDILKRFIAAGIPVVFERGLDVSGKGWMGHYGVVYAYDDSTQKFRIPDSYEGDRTISYEELEKYWGHFDYVYFVIYPPDRESEVMAILGPHADEAYNLTYAAEEASNRTYETEGRELFFAWYSRGMILAEMRDYYGAALAYDQAYAVYRNLPESERPWRMTWYQTGPYFAYYYTGRYYDVLALANQTLDGQTLFGFDFQPAFEETWVWRGRAKVMLGDTSGAIADFQEALKWHPEWWVAENELRALGVEP